MDRMDAPSELAQLREENRYLRAAAHSFGELAERLAKELRLLRAAGDTRTQSVGKWRVGAPAGKRDMAKVERRTMAFRS